MPSSMAAPVKNRRILLFPVPLQGHINPMIQLAQILHTQGFGITIIHTRFNSPNPSKYPHFTFHQISDGLLEHETNTSDIVALLAKLNINCAEPFREILAGLLSDDDESVACLITDTIWYFTQELADSFKLPRIAFRTTSVCSFLGFNSLPLFRKLGYLPKKDSELEVKVPEFPPLKMKDIPWLNSEDPECLFFLVSSMMEKTKLASGLVINSFEELESEQLENSGKEFRIPTFAVGPLHKYFPASSSSLIEQDRSAIEWLDKQPTKSVIYVSFGSIAEMDQSQLSEVAWGIADSRHRFLWVLRQGLVQNSSGLENLPEKFLTTVENRGYIVNWAPQPEVLAHPAVAGFWTHSGWNSTVESICEGVPMMCSPFFGDQLVNSRFVSDVWKIGVHLEKGFLRSEIEKAVKRIMGDEEIRGRVEFFKNEVAACVEVGGSSHQSLQRLIELILSF